MIKEGLNFRTENFCRLTRRKWQQTLNLNTGSIVGDVHEICELILISRLPAMMSAIMTECLIGTLSTLFRTSGNRHMEALDISNNLGGVVHEHVDCRAQLVPLVWAVMELINPLLTELLQFVNSDELSRVEGLKKSLETNHNKLWSMDNFRQQDWIMEGSFDYWTVVHLWMDI